MNNNKQSSVEWLFEQIARRQGSILQTIQFYDDNQDLLQQAKAMHKEEIMDANSFGYQDGIMYANGEDWMYQNSEHYYEETFGGNNESN